MPRLRVVPALFTGIVLSTTVGLTAGHGASRIGNRDRVFESTVAQIERLPYQPSYAPAGLDAAFPGQNVANTAPAEDYTSGSIPGSADAPAWPAGFKQITIHSLDGAPLIAEFGRHAGRRPGVLVVHGFNTHGILSVIRWAAALYASGYDVLAADQRDFYYENNAGYGYPKYLQTFGWKESQDVLAAGTYLRHLAGVTAVGVVGFSEGAQNTVLAMSMDRKHVFSAGITFSGPADQDTQIYSTASPPSCASPLCTFPATDALIAVVVPPYGSYSNPCQVLDDAAAYYHVGASSILAHESAMHAQTHVTAPLLNFYSADDSLVNPTAAAMMAAFERGSTLQRTLEISHGEHAYFFDRWWDQKAILVYFKKLLPVNRYTRTGPTVNQTPGGSSLSSQLVTIPKLTRAQANAKLAPYICNTSLPPPAR
ncbi:MAG TPA: hypothetical protein VG815_20305 [Chloroflexota bacterium]|jgi:hypothetical protein|nr:hypothetical protein [Chloroflexota bacterium]